ncbi:MAG: hypothetical protein LBC02_03320 [Planctomycetaceae bacterium]|jgi:hypothetical protein|nr:hypothetical protein [Planctomycetaceae bacterium]
MEFTRFIRMMLCFVILLVFLTETASAQFIRRQLRRIPGFPTAEPGYRVGSPTTPEPLIQGDGRLLERVRNIVNLFTENGTELKPVAVISFASFDEFKRVLQIVAKEIRLDKGSLEEPALLNAFLAVYERIVGQGFDTSQPLGIILQTDGILYYPLLFTPLNLNSKLGQSLKNDYAEQLPDGRYAIRQEIFNWPLGRLYVQQHNGWVFIASEQQLKALPNNPTTLLQGLDRKHLIAARFDLQNLPSLSTRAALTLGEMNAVAQAETELEKATARLGIGYLRSLAEQADFLEYTFSYDEEHADYVIEQKEIVKPNTERAALLQQRRNAQSPFHAFYRPENAVLASHFVMNLTQSQSRELETILDESLGKKLLTEEERLELQKRSEEKSPTSRKRRTPKTPLQSETESKSETEKKSEIEKKSETESKLETEKKSETEKKPEPETVPNVPTSPNRPSQEQSLPKITVPDSITDPNERLAQLLAQIPLEQIEKEMVEETETTMPDLVLSKTQEGNLTDVQKLEVIFRRVGVAYYWALIGAVRSGRFDAASTCSFEQGIIGVYNIVEGKKFRESFDSVFADIEKEFPEVYARNIRKDYMESEGFVLTSISFRPGMFIKNQLLSWLIPPEYSERETRLVLGVRDDALCFAVGSGDFAEQRLLEAIAGTTKMLPVYDMFFTFSAYELGRAFAQSGRPDRLVPLKIVAANTNPNARAYAVSKFTDTSKTLTLRISALLTPSLWRFRENLREARYYRWH